MKIKTIKIENFKAINSLLLRPKQINILVGRNNTGKTSVLQAISMAFDNTVIDDDFLYHPGSLINFESKTSTVEAEFVSKRRTKKIVKLSHPDLTALTTILIAFTERFIKQFNQQVKDISKGRKQIETTRDSGTPFERVELKLPEQDFFQRVVEVEKLKDASESSLIVNRNKNTENFLSREFLELEREIEKKLIDGVKNVEKSGVEWRSLTRDWLFRSRFERNLFSHKRFRSKISKENSPIFVSDPMSALEDSDEVEDTDLVGIEKDIEEIIKRDRLLPGLERFRINALLVNRPNGSRIIQMDLMGDGFKSLVGLIYEIRSAKRGHIIMLEEPEVHLHPGYLMELVKNITDLSKDSDLQFFISTHSSDLIQFFLDNDALGKERSSYLSKNLEIIRLNKTEDSILPDFLDYREAQKEFKNLEIDLRGI